jgi:hypothetical protein
VIQAVADGLQLQWLIDPSVDMAGIIEKLIDALFPPAPAPATPETARRSPGAPARAGRADA